MGTYFQALPARLLLYIALPMLLTVGVVGVLVGGALERQFERRMQEDVEMVARALQRPVSHALERHRQGSLHSALESALDIGRVYGAYLYSDGGELLASLGTVHEPHQPEAPAGMRHRTRGGGSYGHIGGEAVYSYYVPVRLSGDGNTGLLRITRRKSDMDTFMSRLRLGGVAIVLLLGVVMTATVILGYHRAAGIAFRDLRASMSRIRAGDHSHRASVRGPHEVRNVAEGLNSMLDAIQSTEQRLERVRGERRELQTQLGASERLAGIGRLAAGIAHELGTPLGTVAGRVQRVKRRDDLAAPTVRELDSMATELRRMERLVREVLDFGRRDELRLKRVGAGEMLSMVRSTVTARGEVASGARLEIRQGEGSLASSVGLDGDLEVDPSRVEQALANLVRNALQAAPTGRVRLGWRSQETQIVFVVEDDGPGVPVEQRERIFQPFVTSRGEDGTGLGLAIVAAVAHEHGGEVRVGNSELGGARFELALPRTPEGPRRPGADLPEEALGRRAG